MKNHEVECIYSPLMEKFFKDKRKNEAIRWLPMPCSLIFSDELMQICTTSRYIYFAFLLLCGVRGGSDIPLRINYLSTALGVHKRTLTKAIDELIGANLLHKRERKKEEKEEKSTDNTERESENGVARVSFENLSENNAENDAKSPTGVEKIVKNASPSSNRQSEFSVEECLRYVEKCLANGEEIKNAKALAIHLSRTGAADAFVRHALFPEKQAAADLKSYGEPRLFTDEPCSICYDGKMSDPDGRGFRPCSHCKNERGKSTGREPFKS